MDRPVLEALRNNMRQALARRSFKQAAAILYRLKKEDPLSRQTRGFELELYLSLNRNEQAESVAAQLCLLFPDSARILYLAGKAAYRLKSYEAAEERFRESQRISPRWQAGYWIGKTLTQLGKFEEAESFLLAARPHTRYALLDLAWLCERRNDLEGALREIEDFLSDHPDHSFARTQRTRLRARLLEPDALIEEVESLMGIGEEPSSTMIPEYVERLFQTGQTAQARRTVEARLADADVNLGLRLAWICHRARAYDLSCALFLRFLEARCSNYKYLSALESAARKCGRLPEVLEAYRRLATQSPHLFGRLRLLSR